MRDGIVKLPLFYRICSSRLEHMFPSLHALVEQRRQVEAAEAAWLQMVAEYDRYGDWRAAPAT